VAEQVGLGSAGAAVDALDGDGVEAAAMDHVGAVDGAAGPGSPVSLSNGVSSGSPAGSGNGVGPASAVGPDGTEQRAHGHKFVFDCPMRWGDMDSFGHINNVVYLQYLEQARVEWMFHAAREAGVPDFSLGTVVARHEIAYKRPLVYRAEPVRIDTWVTEIKNGSINVAYEIRDPDCVYVTASSVIVPYKLEENRPRRLTPQERAFLEQYLIPHERKKPAAQQPRRAQ
jgi:acyl-CoA thioester hydrolase